MSTELPSEGEQVTINYESAMSRMMGERRDMEITVTDVQGNIVYAENPHGEAFPTLVIDPDHDLWARDENGRDGLYGTRVRFE